MLSAIRKMSNIFLHPGQNIEIADKNCLFTYGNFGSRGGLGVY
jgi:hypothetical protein